jgi:hypothetical protein
MIDGIVPIVLIGVLGLVEKMNDLIPVINWNVNKEVLIFSEFHIKDFINLGFRIYKRKFDTFNSFKLYGKRFFKHIEKNNIPLPSFKNIIMFILKECKSGIYKKYFMKNIRIVKFYKKSVDYDKIRYIKNKNVKRTREEHFYVLMFNETFYSFLKTKYNLEGKWVVYLDWVFSQPLEMQRKREEEVNDLYNKIMGEMRGDEI